MHEKIDILRRSRTSSSVGACRYAASVAARGKAMLNDKYEVIAVNGELHRKAVMVLPSLG